jgi:hypothetical protein
MFNRGHFSILVFFAFGMICLAKDFQLRSLEKVVHLKYNGTFFGLMVEDFDKTKIDDEALKAFRKKSGSEAFKIELLMALSDPEQTLQAYVLLNRLFPDRALNITSNSFMLDMKNSRIPIKVQNGKRTVILQISMAEFGATVQSYWENQFELWFQVHDKNVKMGLIKEKKKLSKAEKDKEFLRQLRIEEKP